jgi:hypothetical protein
MTLVAKSDQSTGNAAFASYVLQSNELVFSFTAPYSRKAPRADGGAAAVPLPGYSQDVAYEFLNTHGLGVRAVGESRPGCCWRWLWGCVELGDPLSDDDPLKTPQPNASTCTQSRTYTPNPTQPNPTQPNPTQPGILVDDAAHAYAEATANGGVGVLPPTPLADCAGGAGGAAVVSEVKLYGDVVLRFVSGDYQVRVGCVCVCVRGGDRLWFGLWLGGGGFTVFSAERGRGVLLPAFAVARNRPSLFHPFPSVPPPAPNRAPTSPASRPPPRPRASATACGGWTTPSATPTTSSRRRPTSST